LMALYLHLGPFSKHVISEIDRRIAELDSMHPVRATESSAGARPLKDMGNNDRRTLLREEIDTRLGPVN